MKLAVNFSKALISLLEKEPDLPVDYIKVPTIPFPECWSQFDRGETYRRLLPHPAQPGVIALGHSDRTRRFNKDLIIQVVKRTSPPYLSTHVEARVEFFPELKEYQHNIDPVLKMPFMVRFLNAINEVKQIINLQLILENFPYYTWWRHYRLGSDPGFISELCREGDCGFLLDIAHARCSAWYLKMKPEDYLKALPLKRVKEIHLAGVIKRPEGLRDSHTKMSEDDYRLFQYVLGICDPETVTIEYGGLPDRLLNLEGEFEMLSRNNPFELREMITRVRVITGSRN